MTETTPVKQQREIAYEDERRDNFGLGLSSVVALIIGGLFTPAVVAFGLFTFRKAHETIKAIAWLCMAYGVIPWVMIALAGFWT